MHAITLRQIEIFYAVMTTGNLTEAAALLQTSQNGCAGDYPPRYRA